MQNKPLDIIEYSEYYLLNENNYVRRVEVAVSWQGSAADVIINMETLKKMRFADEDFPKIKNYKFKEGAEKLDDLFETNEVDEYWFSNRYVQKETYRVEETEKEATLREIELKLVNKYTPDVFQDSV